MGNMNILLKIIRFLKGQLVNLSYSEIIRTKISYIPNHFQSDKYANLRGKHPLKSMVNCVLLQK